MDRGDGLQGVCDESAGAAREAAGAFAESLRHDDWRRRGGGDRGQKSVEPADAGVAVPGALLGVAVDLEDRAIDSHRHQAHLGVRRAPVCAGPGW